MEWDDYWRGLLADNKIKNKVCEIDNVDEEIHGEKKIEKICHCIYNDYDELKEELEKVRQDLLLLIDTFPGVHLQTSRVKSLDSLLCKVIIKRHAHMLDKNNPYHDINEFNYKDIITDLIGIRLIISYRGKWVDIHRRLIEIFPYAEDSEYKMNHFIPYPKDGTGILAEIPIVYYAYGDDLNIYDGINVDFKLKDNGYRSVHYVVSYKRTYIEIQTRTIYDEAWNDCDHNYVYKQEAHSSYSALKDLSNILSLVTNASNDLGESMQLIFEENMLRESNGKYYSNSSEPLKMQEIFDRLKKACEQLEEFERKVVEMRGDSHGK